MSHNTTSWNSHSNTWRWTAGKDRRSPEGGKARQVGGRPALACQKAIGQHDQREMAMQAIPAAALVMVQATLAFGIFVELLNRPAAMRHLHQALQRRVRWEVTVIPLHLTALARQGTLAEQPTLWPGGDPMMAGGQLCPPVAQCTRTAANCFRRTVSAAARQVIACQRSAGRASRTALAS